MATRGQSVHTKPVIAYEESQQPIQLVYDTWTPRPHFIVDKVNKTPDATMDELQAAYEIIGQFLNENREFDHDAILSFHRGNWYQQHTGNWHAHLCVTAEPYLEKAMIAITEIPTNKEWKNVTTVKEGMRQWHERKVASYKKYQKDCVEKIISNPSRVEIVALSTLNSQSREFSLAWASSTPRIAVVAQGSAANIATLASLYAFMSTAYFGAEKALKGADANFGNFGCHFCLHIESIVSMFDCAQSLILNEEVLNHLPEEKRSVFIYEWLCFVNQVLVAAQQNDIRDSQYRIIEQILQQTHHAPGPPVRRLIGQTLTTLCTLGDPASLPVTIKHCHEILRSNDDSSKLTAIVILGALYEDLARPAGRLYEVTVPLLLTLLKNGESQIRVEVLSTLERIVNGLGSVPGTIHREISKVARTHLCDRAMAVRIASAKCLTSLIPQSSSTSSNELEGNIELAFRAFEGCSYDVRRVVAKYLATLLVAYQTTPASTSQSLMNRSSTSVTTARAKRLEETLTYLAGGFSRGTIRMSKSDTSEHLMTIQSEIRIGVTYAYIEWVRMLSSQCLEQNLSLLISHLLELTGDTLHSRQCVTFILRSVINSQWNERVHLAAAKELLTIIKRHATTTSPVLTNSIMQSSINSMTQSYESSLKTHLESIQLTLALALHTLSFLTQRLGPSTMILVQDSSISLFETLFHLLIHPSFSVRVSAAWCFRSISTALPSLLTPLIDQCLEKIQWTTELSTTDNADALSGYAVALQALLGTVNRCRSGIPSVRVKAIVNFAEDLLRTAVGSIGSQEQSLVPRFLLQRIHSAWHLLAACCSLDQSYLKFLLPRLFVLWSHVFPRSSAEFEQEQQRGDSFTWTLTLNQRSDALCSMIALLHDEHNSPSEDVLKHMLNPIESAILILHHIPTLIKHFGQQLKGPAMLFRLRLYQLLCQLPTHLYERHFQILLKASVAELTLSDNAVNTSTSILKSLCHPSELILLGPGFSETIEEHLQSPSVHYYGALEHDETYLYRRSPSIRTDTMASQSPRALPEQWNISTPMPLNIAVVDAAIVLFSRLFPRTPDKHRLQVLQHFLDIIKLTKGSRQETVQVNVLTAVSMALRRCADNKSLIPIDHEHCKKFLCTLVMSNVCRSNALLRCVAGETLARLIQISDDERFRADIAQYSLDRLKEARDLPSRAGYCLALGCLYRYVDASNAGQCLNLAIPILLAFAQDASTSGVQVWALHTLALGAQYSGHLFRQQIESITAQILRLLLTLPSYQTDVFSCCARLLISLIKIISPELQMNTISISTIRSLFLTVSQLLQSQSASAVKAESMHVLQQLHLSAPRHVNLSRLIPELIQALADEDLLVKRASVTCLKQLAQREAKEICKYAREDLSSRISEYQSLEELLFAMLDRETEIQLCVNLQETLLCLVQASGKTHPAAWLTLLKSILVETEEPSNNDHPASLSFDSTTADDDPEDVEQVTSKSNANLIPRLSSLSQWHTKIFAIVCADQLITCCEHSSHSNLHFNSISAREHLRTYPNEDYLVLHLNTLVVFSLIACRSANDQLRSLGLLLLKHLLLRFSRPKQQMDSTDDLVLEQYQTQISAALRPSFSQDTPSHVTAQACDVCSVWISNGVGDELHDLRRAHQLLVVSLQKLTGIEPRRKETNMLQHEHQLTTENLAVLKVWADVYQVAIERHQTNRDHPHATFLSLMQPELDILIYHWLAALTDYAFLILPNDFGGGGDQLSRDGNFYSVESDLDEVRTLYQATWPSLVRAATHWLAEHDYEPEQSTTHPKRLGHGRQDVLLTKFLTLTLTNEQRIVPEKKEDLFIMLLGCCVQALSIAQPTDQTTDAILSAMSHLVRSHLASSQMTMPVCVELVHVLQRLFLLQPDPRIHSQILELIHLLFDLVSTLTVSNETFLSASLQFFTIVLLSSYPNLASVLRIDAFEQLPSVSRTNASQSVDLVSSAIELLNQLIRLASTDEDRQRLMAVIVRLLLSVAFVLLAAPLDPATSLLPRIVRFVETSFAVCKDPKTAQDAISTVIDLRRTLIDKRLSDNGYFLRCLTALIVNAPSFPLTNQMIHVYQQALHDPLSETHIQALECLHQVFLSKKLPLRNTFIRMFTPSLISQLKQSRNSHQIIEILKIFETLLSAVDPTSRVRFASLTIPLFINYLPDSTSSTPLHLDSCLITYITERLEYLICTYPNECRSLLHCAPELRLKLEHQKRHEREVHFQQQDSHGIVSST